LTAALFSGYIPAMFADSALRLLIYDEIVRTGGTPTVSTLARLVSSPLDDVRASLRRMHDAHMLVLQPTNEILMANPFSAVPTPFVAEVEGRRWFGNCIWDCLGIIAMLHADGRVLRRVVRPARQWSCPFVAEQSLAKALSTSRSPLADGGKILSLIEKPCSSFGRKRWWTAGAVIGICRAARLSRLKPAGPWRVSGITTAATRNGADGPWTKPTPCSTSLASPAISGN
jgi:Alkylmercury lyase